MSGIILTLFGGAGGVVAPVGLIVPYTSATAPTNWSLFTAANGRLLVGAGGSYASTTSGGSASPSISGALSATGSHTGSGFDGGNSYYLGAPSTTSNTSGSHSHTFSGTASAQDLYKTFTLIKCTAASMLPANSLLLAASTLAGLSNTEAATDRFIMAHATPGSTGGSSSLSGSVTSSTAGSHSHGDILVSGEGTTSRVAVYAGSHSHPTSISGSLNTKRIYLSAWTDAAAAFGVALGGIAMYEGTTAPTGWALCNGTAATPDLRDFFVRIGTTANHGTTSGNNSVSWAASTSNGASHSHNSGSALISNGGWAYHNSDGWSHTHTASGTTTITQPYYALSFIKYVG